MKISSLKKVKVSGKIVFLRSDFNVPIDKKGKIGEDFKIARSLETIKYLLQNGAKVMVTTHLGDPDGKRLKQYSTAPLAKHLQKLLNLHHDPIINTSYPKYKVTFVPDCIGLKVTKALEKIKPNELLFLENLRYYKEEKKNDSNFAKALAQPADLYVNDAFAVCHREQASVGAIKKFLPAYAGLLLTQEVESLNKVLKPKKPLVSIIGGSKISTKAPLVKKLYAQSNHLLIGGALANNFFLACGYEVGKSLIDKDSIAFAKKYFSKSKRDKKIILPIDVVVRNDKKKVTVKKLTAIAKNDMILDIGPESISLFAIYIKKAQTLAWNGPMGKFEEDSFKHGTLAVARLIATRSTGHAFGVVGGGETVEVLKMSKMFEYVDWVSTGGGAMLSYLGGEKMPGLKGIVN